MWSCPLVKRRSCRRSISGSLSISSPPAVFMLARFLSYAHGVRQHVLAAYPCLRAMPRSNLISPSYPHVQKSELDDCRTSLPDSRLSTGIPSSAALLSIWYGECHLYLRICFICIAPSLHFQHGFVHRSKMSTQDLPLTLQPTSLVGLPDNVRRPLIAVSLFGLLSLVTSSALFIYLTIRLARWKIQGKLANGANQFLLLIYNLLLADSKCYLKSHVSLPLLTRCFSPRQFSKRWPLL
jgi:hypothetical protein